MKNERKDEMKNRISLALKDPILQQGFEIICKKNAELKSGCGMCYRKDKEQLTTAKEIIRELLLSDTRKGSDWTGYLIDLKERAEQFLKE